MLTRDERFNRYIRLLAEDISEGGYFTNKYPKLLEVEDDGHGLDHVTQVAKDAYTISCHMENPYGYDIVLAIAGMYHDLGRIYGREEHHMWSMGMVKENWPHIKKRLNLKGNRYITSDQIYQLVLKCILFHRHSPKHSPVISCIEIIQVADKLRFCDLSHIVDRSLSYRLTTVDSSKYSELDIQDLTEDIFYYITDKYDKRLSCIPTLQQFARVCIKDFDPKLWDRNNRKTIKTQIYHLLLQSDIAKCLSII
jgi:hypothetical protein